MSDPTIAGYAATGPAGHAAVCRLLQSEIERALPKAAARIWHAMPVWFLGGNPIVGYKITSRHVNLLFWNGQAFADCGLTAAGKFKAAQVHYTDAAQVDIKALRRWLKRSGTHIWDYEGMRAAAGRRA